MWLNWCLRSEVSFLRTHAKQQTAVLIDGGSRNFPSMDDSFDLTNNGFPMPELEIEDAFREVVQNIG